MHSFSCIMLIVFIFQITAPSSIKQDEHGRVQMGVKNPTCDDGQTNLTIDWDIPNEKGKKLKNSY